MILGMDCSVWQDDNSTPQQVNFVKAKAEGIKFVIIKVSQGTWLDQDFIYNWQAAKDAGLYRGAYHYLDNSAPGVDQADFFLGAIDKDPPEMGIYPDYEYRSEPNRDKMYSILTGFADTAVSIYNKRGLYSSPYYWKEYGSTDEKWLDWDLWIANYEVVSPAVPAPWLDWTIWQYTSKGDGRKYGAESAGLDLNYFNGTWDQFVSKYGALNIDPDDTPEIPDDYIAGWDSALDFMQAKILEARNYLDG